jgi:hypothetical protein
MATLTVPSGLMPTQPFSAAVAAQWQGCDPFRRWRGGITPQPTTNAPSPPGRPE